MTQTTCKLLETGMYKEAKQRNVEVETERERYVIVVVHIV
jgi:hypothetical protein